MNKSAKKMKKDGYDGKIGDGMRLFFEPKSATFKLFIPELIIDKGDSYAYIKDRGGNVLNRIRLEGKTNGTDIVTEPKSVSLRDWGLNVLDDFIVTVGEESLHSVDKDYLIFLNNGDQSGNLHSGINFIARKPGVTLKGKCSTYCEGDNLVIDLVSLGRGESVRINGKEFIAHRPWGEFFEISDNELNVLCKDCDGNEWSLYSAHPSISLESDENDLDELRLTIWKDGSEIKELDFGKCRESVPPGYDVSFGDRVCVDMNMETILRGYGEGTYRLEFNKGSKPLNYLCIPGFTYAFDNNVYFGSNGSLTINWNIDDRIEFNSKIENSVSFSHETNGGNVYDMSVEIPSFRYSFDGKEWFVFDSKRYYYRDLDSDTLYVKTPHGDEGYLSISVPEARPLEGFFENGVNMFDLKKITSVAGYVKDYRFYVYFNPKSEGYGSEKVFPISVNAGYLIDDGRVRVGTRPAGDVSYRLTVEYGNGDVITVPFEEYTAVFDEEGFEKITVQEIVINGSGNENVRNTVIVPREIVIELDGSKIRRNELPECIGYQYGNYEGEINPKYFESMIVGERYTDEYNKENLESFFMENAYGDKLPDMMARKLFAEIEAQILKIQTDSECKHSLIRLFNKYVNVRNDFAKTVLDRFETLYPDDSALQHLKRYL